jgi:phenylacetate-CoA ligase
MNMNPPRHPWPPLPSAQLRTRQAKELSRYLRDVVLPFSPHYRALFQRLGLTADSIRTLDDLRRLPFTSKADLLPTPESPQRFKDFILTPEREVLARRPATLLRAMLHGREQVARELAAEFRPVSIHFTTGRAAEPLAFVLTKHDLANIESASIRLMEVCGAQPEFRLVNAFPYAPHLAFWFTHYAGVAFGVLTVSSGGGKVAGTEGNLRLMRKLNPEVLIGVPTFIYHLLHQAAEEGVRCGNLKRIVLGGEKVSDGLRRKLRELAEDLGARNVDVLATYGFTEAKLAWAECPFPHDQPSSGYHLYPDLGVTEIVDPKSGEPVPSGEPGEIVFTPLAARGSVVLRYRTGDFIDGGLVYEPCPYCGRAMPRLVGRISRASEVREMKLDKLKGTLVDFNEIEHVLDDAPHVGAWQVELRKAHDDPHEVDELILHVQKSDTTDDHALATALNARFYAHTEIHPNRIEFHDAETLRRLQGLGVLMKEQKIVDHRPPAGDTPKPPPSARQPCPSEDSHAFAK